MPTIDERVVSMAFENAVFEQRVAVTMTTLSKLNTAIAQTGQKSGLSNIETDANKIKLEAPMSALDKLKAKLGRTNSGTTFTNMENASNKVTLEQPSRALDNLKNKLDRTNAGTTFTDMENAGNRINLSGLANALDGIKTHLSGLETAAAVAFGNIATKAAGAATNFAKSFTFAPVKQGFEEYQTNLGAIQTTLSNTADSGGNLKTVNAALGELNTYSDKTIYNFSEMAKNVGTFTAAGVQLKPAVASIKGIANLAALSGSNSQQASTAMYQLSQAIASGKVGLQDWNSVVNAGMGGAVFQKSLIRTGVAMGTIDKAAVKIDKATGKATINGQSFRESIMAKPGEKSWLSSEVLTGTLGQLTGDMTDAQLAAKGFTKEQIKAIQAQAKTAQDAATQVKTLPQVFDVAKETIGSGWSKTFQTIFGDFGEAKKTFTELSQTINGFINTNANARNKVLGDWKKLGGRTELIAGIKQAFQDITKILGTVKDAFREVFPAKTGKDLFEMTKSFHSLMTSLEPSKATLENLKRTLAGVFAVAHIGWTIIKDLGKVIFDLLGFAGKGSGGILNFTGSIGDFLVNVDKAVSKGNALGGFFQGITNILRVPIELIKSAGKAIFGLFGGFDGSKADDVAKGVDSVHKAITPLEKVVTGVKNAWKSFSGVLDQFKTIVDPWFEQVKTQFSHFGEVIADGIKGADFDKVLLAFQTTFLGGIFITLKKAIEGGGAGLGGGIFKNISKSLEGLTGTLVAMQKQVQAATLLTVAAAIVALALGVKLMSTIDPKKLASAMTAIAVGLGELGGALKLMAAGKSGVAAMPVIAVSMMILAGAVIILAGAMKIMATMSWEEIAKGLVGIGGALAAIGIGIKLINPVSLIPIAAGLLLVGIALNIIAVAAKIFAEMSWEEMAKGLAGIAGSLLAMGAGLALIGPSILLVGPGLVAAAIGVTLLAGAVSAFGAMDAKKMLQGILGAGLAVAGLGAAMMLIPPTIGASAAGLILLGIGLSALGGAVAIFGNMKVGTLVKGVVGMAGAIVVLGFALIAMEATLPGSLALMATAAALALLVPSITLMGTLPWGVILKGIGGIALAIGVIAAVGAVAAAPLTALGGAMLVFGAALVLVGTAIFIAAKGISLLGENGAKGIGVLVTAITAFVALLPTMIINFVKGLVAIVEEVAKVAPKVVLALGVILDTVIAFIIEQAPKLAVAINALIAAILNVLATNAGPIIQAGWRLIQQLLSGIDSNIGSVITKVGDIITKFINGLATQAPRIVQAGLKLLLSFLSGISTGIPRIVAKVAEMVTKFLAAVTARIPGIIAAGAKLIVSFLNGIAQNIGKIVTAGANLLVKFMEGIGNAIPRLVKKGLEVARKFLNAIADGMAGLADAGFNAIIKFLHGLERSIREKMPELIQAGIGIADALLDGVKEGFGLKGHLLKKALDAVFGLLPGWAKKILGVHSPSTIFAEIGKNTMLGFAKGVDDNGKSALDSAGNLSQGVIDKFKDMFQVQSPSKVLKEIGKEVGHGFRDGLDGSVSDIRNSFSSLREKIHGELETQRNDLKTERDNLADLQKQYADKLQEIANLRSAKKPDKEAINSAVEEANQLEISINKSEKAITKYKGVIASLKGANSSLNNGLKAEKANLIALSKSYDEVSKALDDAKQKLDEATRARDDALKSYTEQFSQLPDWDNLLANAMSEADMTYEELADARRKKREEADKKSRINQVELYKQALRDQIAATKKYQETLSQLRALGLDDATYKRLLAQGLGGQDFATQLLSQGKSGVDTINALDADLMGAATGLATDASSTLYQAGVDAAQGLVDGLKAKKKDLEDAMKSLADAIVDRIKNQLGIRSPSKVFGEVGKNAADGLAQGLIDSSKSVADAASGVGDAAAEAMTNSLANISDKVGSEIDTDLTITPVLDLSQVQKDASQLQDLTNVTPITAAASFGQASVISTETAKAAADAATVSGPAGPSFKFEQNNYSPESLSEVEIYRQTNNQLSQLKQSLGLVGLNSA